MQSPKSNPSQLNTLNDEAVFTRIEYNNNYNF